MKVTVLLFSFVFTPFTLGTYVFPDVPLFHKAPHAGRGFHDLDKRQVDACGPGDTCVEACGAGWAQCGDGTYCYNRAGGEKCCGFMSQSCESTEYCVKLKQYAPGRGWVYNPGCCPMNDTLAQCNAVEGITAIESIGTVASTVPYGAQSSFTHYPSSTKSHSGALITAAPKWPTVGGVGVVGAAGAAIVGIGVWIPFL